MEVKKKMTIFELLGNLLNFNTRRKMKILNYQKEQYRGTIKQIMKVRGLRTISLANYNAWKGNTPGANGIHSLKLDIQDGYLNIYGYRLNGKGNLACGEAIQDAPESLYEKAYRQVMNLIGDEAKIPYSVRKNILVKLAR